MAMIKNNNNNNNNKQSHLVLLLSQTISGMLTRNITYILFQLVHLRERVCVCVPALACMHFK